MHVLVANVAIFLIETLLQKVEWGVGLSCGELSNESKRERAGSNVLILGISQFTENFDIHHPIPSATRGRWDKEGSCVSQLACDF